MSVTKGVVKVAIQDYTNSTALWNSEEIFGASC